MGWRQWLRCLFQHGREVLCAIWCINANADPKLYAHANAIHGEEYTGTAASSYAGAAPVIQRCCV